MDLKVYLAILRGKKWVILITILMTIAVVAGLTYTATPIYVATTTLRIATTAGGSMSSADYMYADRLMNTYVRIATSGPVKSELLAREGITQAPVIRVETVPNTELIKVSVESPDPALAMSAANTLAEILVEQGRELYSGGGKSPADILRDQIALAEAELNQARKEHEILAARTTESSDQLEAARKAVELKENTYASLLEQYDAARLREALRANTISVVEPAGLPLIPARPRKTINLALGAVVGLIGGVGLAFLLEALDGRVYTSTQVGSITGMPMLSKIPSMERAYIYPSRNGGAPPDAPFREAFRRLRMNILARTEPGPDGCPARRLLVISAEPGEGKSTIVVHLAIAMAQTGQRVILVDADMRVPNAHRILNLPNEVGLSSILRRKAHLEDVVQVSHQPGLNVITSGPLPPNPVELLGSAKMQSLLEDLASQYDVILLDAPAFLPVSDAAVLAPMTDGVVLVVRRNQISQDAVREVCKQLEDIHCRTIGVVVNEAEANGSYYYYRRR